LLDARAVTAGYGVAPVVQAIDLHLRAGEFVGLIGPNGCGKSTLLRVLSGALRPQNGEVTLDGHALRQMSRLDIARRIAFVPQVERAAFEFTVQDVVLMGRYPHHGRGRGWTADDYAHMQQALADSDILHLAQRPVTRLSGGEYRRVLLARALAQNSPVMLLDEPTAHLDITHQVELLTLVRNRTRRLEAPIGALAALHDLNQAAEYCDRLVLMCAGRVVADGFPEEVLLANHLRRVYGAEAQIGLNPVTGRPMILALTPARKVAE
jgi:iron complex transport system ATP-binding protein